MLRSDATDDSKGAFECGGPEPVCFMLSRLNRRDGEHVVGPKHRLDPYFLCGERFYQPRVREVIHLLMNAIHQNILPAQANATASALFRRVPSTPEIGRAHV